MKRHDALSWRREKSAALIELAKATPAKDTPASLMKKPVRPRVAAALRRAEGGRRRPSGPRRRRSGGRARRTEASDKPRRGVTSTPAERDRGARFETELHAAGLADARVTVLARPGGGAVFRIEQVTVARVALLAKAARAVHLLGVNGITSKGERAPGIEAARAVAALTSRSPLAWLFAEVSWIARTR